MNYYQNIKRQLLWIFSTIEFKKIDLIKTFIYSIFSSTSGVAQPFIIGKIIDNISTRNSTGIFTNLLLFLFLFLLSQVFLYLKNKKNILIISDIEKNIKIKILNSVLNLDYTQFKKIDNGFLYNIMEQDSTIFSSIIFSHIGILLDCIILVASVGIMLFIHWQLCFILILILPISALIYLFSGKILRLQEQNLKKQYDKYSLFITESYQNFKILKLFSKEEFRSLDFKNRLDQIYGIGIKKITIETLFEIVIQTMMFVDMIIILVVGSYFVFSSHLTIGKLISLVSYSEKFKQSSLSLSKLNSDFQEVYVSLDRINQLFELSSPNKKKYCLQNSNPIKKVSLKNLSYMSGNKKILSNISVDFLPGKINFVKGSSGAGKTTLFNILSGLSKEFEGSITFGDTQYTGNQEFIYQNNISYVTQETLLFTNSIFHNLTFYNDNITLEEVKKISSSVKLTDFINDFEQKYDTKIEKNFSNISGGQAQRINIARGILEKKDIYIFDEIFSSLDSHIANDIFHFIEELAMNSIVIMASHQEIGRMENVLDLDKEVNLA